MEEEYHAKIRRVMADLDEVIKTLPVRVWGPGLKLDFREVHTHIHYAQLALIDEGGKVAPDIDY
jgi:hypothetical protein